MPLYRDSDGQVYWFDEEPEPELVRPDLTRLTPAEEDAFNAAGLE